MGLWADDLGGEGLLYFTFTLLSGEEEREGDLYIGMDKKEGRMYQYYRCMTPYCNC
jgi:hypothetical protein